MCLLLVLGCMVMSVECASSRCGSSYFECQGHPYLHPYLFYAFILSCPLLWVKRSSHSPLECPPPSVSHGAYCVVQLSVPASSSPSHATSVLQELLRHIAFLNLHFLQFIVIAM